MANSRYDARNVSLIIPTFNSGSFLERTLKSIKEQSIQPLEIIVADSPQTTDNTREIAGRYGAKVVDGGLPADGRNAGAAIAKGNLFYFIDSDQWMPDSYWLEGAVEEMNKRRLDAAGTVQETGPLAKPTGGPLRYIAGVVNNWNIQFGYTFARAAFRAIQHTSKPAAQQGMLVSREWFERVGGFDTTTFGEDSVLMERIKAAGGRYAILESVGPIISRIRRADGGGFRYGMRAIGLNMARLSGIHTPIEVYFEKKPFNIFKVLWNRRFD